MIKKIALLLTGIFSISQPISAQAGEAVSASDDRWMVYDRVTPDGKPLVVVTRTGNSQVQTLLHNGRASVVICSTDPSNVNEQGMPQGTAHLYSLEDKLDEAPTLLAAGAIRVASVTGQGERRMFFVHRDPLDLSSVLQSNQVQGFSCRGLKVTDRQMLINLVTPTPLESQLNGDAEVIANLKKSDDDGLIPRKADFWFYGSRGSLNSLVTNLESRGFLLDHWLSDRTGLVLSREMPVDLATFEKVTPILVEASAQAGVNYDGWETVVVSQTSKKSGDLNNQ